MQRVDSASGSGAEVESLAVTSGWPVRLVGWIGGTGTSSWRSAIISAVLLAVVPTTLLGQSTKQPAAGPLAEYTTYLVATHYLRDQAYETHHYFKPLRDGVLQGLVFRKAEKDAPLIEVEWAISQEVFDQLPDWQKDLWHPLAPAVDAGRVRLPGLTSTEEQEMLRTVRGLHAQTFNLAGIKGALPIGLEGVAMVTHITREEMLQAIRQQQ